MGTFKLYYSPLPRPTSVTSPVPVNERGTMNSFKNTRIRKVEGYSDWNSEDEKVK